MLTDNSDLTALSELLGCSVGQLQEEFLMLLGARVSLLLRPADFASERQAGQYIRRLTGCEPTPEQVEIGRRAKRRIRLTDDQKIFLERQQHDRCRLCGRFLDLAAHPHVDHIIPLAQGGEDKLSNLQLLCRACNLGKGDLSSWLLGIPYQSEDRSSPRVRYVVLARARGECSEVGCDATSLFEELELVSRVPLGLGGRWLFDNLRVVCRTHADRIGRERKSSSRRALDSGTRKPRKIIS